MGDVISGRFDVVNGVIHTLGEADTSDLHRVAHILEEEKDRDRLVERIEQEAPSASNLARYLPKDAKALAAYLGVLYLLLKIVLSIQEAALEDDEPVPPAEIHIQIEHNESGLGVADDQPDQESVNSDDPSEGTHSSK